MLGNLIALLRRGMSGKLTAWKGDSHHAEPADAPEALSVEAAHEEADTAPDVWRSIRIATERLGEIAPDARRDTVPWESPTASAKSACLIDPALRYEDSAFMTPCMPDRNIPVKHSYSRPEFGYTPEVGSFQRMNNISAIRKSKGYSQADLADKVGIEQGTISKIENGYESVTLRTLQAIAEALGVKVADLFIDRTDAERAIIAAYRAMSEQRQRGWQDLAKTMLLEDERPETPPVPENGSAADQSS